MQNDVLKAIAERYSCRAFTDRMPSDEQLSAIADAAVMAPSGVNAQPWKVVVVKDRQLMQEFEQAGMASVAAMDNKAMYERIMSRGEKIYYNAPCMFMIPIKDGGEMDCGILCENIALAAQSLGLGSLICGMAAIPLNGEKGEDFKARMGFEDGYKFGIAVLVGYPEGTGTPHEPDRSKISYVG